MPCRGTVKPGYKNTGHKNILVIRGNLNFGCVIRISWVIRIFLAEHRKSRFIMTETASTSNPDIPQLNPELPRTLDIPISPRSSKKPRWQLSLIPNRQVLLLLDGFLSPMPASLFLISNQRTSESSSSLRILHPHTNL